MNEPKVDFIPQFTSFPASNLEKRNELYECFARRVQKQLNFLVDGKNFTNNIFVFENDNYPLGTEKRIINDKEYVVLPAGYDGVIIDFSKNKDSSIVIPTADCASIAFRNEKDKLIGCLHAGYKGTAAGIIDNLFKLTMNKERFFENTKFYISPLAGDDFELPVSYYKELFEEYLSAICIDPYDSRYFNKKKGESEKCQISLLNIIKDILATYGVSPENIYVDGRKTTDPKNSFYSYRLHSNYKAMQEKFSENFELIPFGEKFTPPADNSNYYKKLLRNPNHSVNRVDGRMATIIKT